MTLVCKVRTNLPATQTSSYSTPNGRKTSFDLKIWVSSDKYLKHERRQAFYPSVMLMPACTWRWASHVARMGEKGNAYRLLMGKPEGNRPLGRPWRRWVDNIRMDLGEVGWGDVDWIGLAKDRNSWRAVVNWVLNLRVPWNAGKL
jgi:hypothetical protein